MIVGITGSLGGGKGTVVEYLKEKKGFTHHSVSDMLTEVLIERGEDVNREGMNRIANEFRAASPGGPTAEVYARCQKNDDCVDVIIESQHSPAEVNYIKRLGGKVIGVTADSDIRYERITARGSVKDNVTKEEFIAQQKREEEGTGDPTKSNIFDAIKAADFVVQNNGTLEELHDQVDEILKQLQT